jgi:hypothetical protein
MQIHRHNLYKPPGCTVAPAFYRLREVIKICALSRSTIYRRIAAARFQRPSLSADVQLRGDQSPSKLGLRIQRATTHQSVREQNACR